MTIAIVKAPWWVRYCPPYLLSFLATYLRNNGYEVKLSDFNNKWYHRVSEKYKKYWDDRDYYSFWEKEDFVREISKEVEIEKDVKRILDSNTDIAIFETHTPNVILSYEVAKLLKDYKKNLINIFIGHKASRAQMAYDFIKQPFIDYVSTGEIDIPILKLLKEFKNGINIGKLPKVKGLLSKDNGKIIDLGNPDIIKNLDLLPFPEYDDFKEDIKNKTYSMPNRLDILDSRGCVNACYYCYERLFWQKYRTMSGKRIYEQILYHIKNYPQINYFYFNGLLLNGSLEVLEEFCNLVIKNNLKINWAGQAMIREDMSKDLILKMKEAGCNWLGFGIESGSERVLKDMNKNYKIEDALRVLKDVHEAGISTQINIMFGYPTETEEDFRKTLDFVLKVRPYIDSILASQSFTTLEKGTYLYKNAEKFGIKGVKHHLFWKAQDGKNNYLERFKRYEKFCKFALSLGIPETSGVLRERPDKDMLIREYFNYEKQVE